MNKSRRMALAVLLVWGAACSSDRGTEPIESVPGMSASARSYLDAVVGTMQANSMHRAKIDWNAVRAEVAVAASGAQSVRETYPGIRTALVRLGDGHSSYRGVDGVTLSAPTRTCVGSGATIPGNIPPDIGYVKVGAFSGTSEQALAFAAAIQNTIRSADRDDLIGWIVDLRGNSGGNMWPMIAGLGPVLGDGILGWFISPVGAESPWEYRNGAALSNNVAVTTVPDPYTLKNANPRVAVLVDNLVASSGEATFIAFRKRANTRSFGVSTCGLSTANAGFPMSDGALLNLTVSVMADRTKTPYGGQLSPDESIVGQPAGIVNRAIGWLQTGIP